jgi:hypothetical protein
VTIQKRLFAVSDSPDVQATLTTQDAIVAAIQAAQSYNIGATVRLQWYDPEAATAWLSYCRSGRFSRETINALPSLEQNARVSELWTSFGNYWRCLNVSPYGWARFRNLCERLWGYPAHSAGGDGWKGKINTPQRNGQYGGAWRQRAHAAIYSPAVAASQAASYSPRFGAHRAQFITSGGNPEFGPTDVVFGMRASYALENAGNRPGESGVLPNTNFAPTVEVHRIWMQRDGGIMGGYPRGLDRQYADENGLSSIWHGYNFSEPPANNPGRWDDWTVGFVHPMVRSEVAIVDTTVDTQWTVPPLLWYWEMLRAEYPLVTGSGYLDIAGYSGFPEIAPSVTASILEYLGSKTPEEIIREVMFDVMQRNAAMARTNGLVATTLGDAAGLAEIDRRRDAAVPSTASMIVSGAVTAVGGVVSLATANPAGLAVAGMVSQAVKLVDSLASSSVEERRTDIFGRLMPVLDTVGIVDSQIDARQVIGAVGRPGRTAQGQSIVELATAAMGNGLTMELPDAVMASLQLSSPTHGIFRIIGMPPAGRIEMGQDRRAPSCRWEGDAQAVYSCGAEIGGNFWLRVTSPDGETRMARTGVAQGAATDVTWASMFREHRYGITGLPQGTAVFVDGAPAMGTWTDASMAEWHVFMPQGPHDVRLVAPGMAPVLVTVRAEGDVSRATWGALQTASVQQRQTAAGGSSVGLIVAGVVGVGALALFLATVVMDGKPAPKRNPRR